MRHAISILADCRRAMLMRLRVHGYQFRAMVDATVRMLAECMSNPATRRMRPMLRPIPIRIDERRDTRR
jgi:hypothetical protein